MSLLCCVQADSIEAACDVASLLSASRSGAELLVLDAAFLPALAEPAFERSGLSISKL